MGAEVAPGRPLALVGQRAGLPVVLALVGARQHLQGGRVRGGCTIYLLPRAWTLLRPAWASGWGRLGLYLEAVNVELCRLQHVLGDLVRLQKLPAVCQVLHRGRPPTGGARTRGAAARRCGRQMVRTSAGRRSPDPRAAAHKRGLCAAGGKGHGSGRVRGAPLPKGQLGRLVWPPGVAGALRTCPCAGTSLAWRVRESACAARAAPGGRQRRPSRVCHDDAHLYRAALVSPLLRAGERSLLARRAARVHASPSLPCISAPPWPEYMPLECGRVRRRPA
jgi:hypothetical protein